MNKIYNKDTNVFDFKVIKIYPNMSYSDLKNNANVVSLNRKDCYDGSGYWITTSKFIYDKFCYVLEFFFINDILAYFSIYITDYSDDINKEERDFDDSELIAWNNRIDEWLSVEKVVSNDVFDLTHGVDIRDYLPKINIVYKWYVSKRKEDQLTKEKENKRNHPIRYILDKILFNNKNNNY